MNPDELVPGCVYFLLTYTDESCTIPRVAPVTFVGENAFGKDVDPEPYWGFRRPEGPTQSILLSDLLAGKGVPDPADEPASVVALPRAHLELVVTVDALIEKLNEVRELDVYGH